MVKKFFGTDGIRGVVGKDPITPEFMVRLGFAAGKVFAAKGGSGKPEGKATVLIGKDTRLSGYMLESALQSGLAAAGADILLAGPIPTPGVAYLTRALRLNAGIVISASHNPYQDNGIKFFSSEGKKLPDAIELEIESFLDRSTDLPYSQDTGKARRVTDASGRYVEFCKQTFPDTLSLTGKKIVLDCAHGATYQVAPTVFRELGAEVVVIGAEPDGMNINRDCGALHPEALIKTVLSEKADFGVAFDGDGDRLMMIDSNGRLFDGDQLLYVIARSKSHDGKGVVGTLMTNLAIENALNSLGIDFVRSAVGDRYVHEKLVEKQWVTGGEGSGHILCLDKHTTGDGIVSALQVISALLESQSALADTFRGIELYPQVLRNIRLAATIEPSVFAEIEEIGDHASDQLGANYRVLLRRSGTEPLLRVMVEGPDQDIVDVEVKKLVNEIERVLQH